MFAPPLPGPAFALALLIVLGAGVVRGFGFSALCVAGLTLVASPAKIVPPIFVLEVLASISLLKSAAPDVDRRWLSWLVLGNALAIPLGIAVLAYVPEAALRLIIGALLLTAALLLLRAGMRVSLTPTAPARLGVGLVSGFVNGVAAIGGIAVAVLLSTSALAPAAMRATMIGLFLFTGLYALACAALLSAAGHAPTELLGIDTLRWVLWLTPAMLLGIWLGQRSFAGVSPKQFRRGVLNLLIMIALLGVLRAAVEGFRA